MLAIIYNLSIDSSLIIMKDTYSIEEVPLKVVMILSYGLNPLFMHKKGIIFQHFGDALLFSVLILCMELYSGETDKFSRPDMSRKYPINSEKSLASDLIIIRVVNWNSGVPLPNDEGLGH